MNLSKQLLVLCFFLFGMASFAGAQDIIYTLDGKEITGKVTEIGIREVKYIRGSEGQGPVVTLRKSNVIRIRFADGTEESFTPDPMSVNMNPAALEKTRAIKFAFLSPLGSKLEFGYEQMINPGFNLDARLGIIGPSLNQVSNVDNPRGIMIAVGPKWWLGSDYVREGVRYAHPLRGTYFKVEAAYSNFRTDASQSVVVSTNPWTVNTIDGHVQHNGGALNLILGKQWILGNIMTLDLYGGLGYGFAVEKVSDNLSNQESYFYSVSNYYSHLYGSDELPITVTSGLRLGVLF